jgi:hypothetical protein
MTSCQVQWKNCTGLAEIKHHINYFPEETIAVCKKCHRSIHYGNHPELQKYLKYTPGDAQVFYSQKKRMEEFIQRLAKGKIR